MSTPSLKSTVLVSTRANNTAISAASTTYYLDVLAGFRVRNSNESRSQYRVPVDGTLKNLRVVLDSNGRSTATTVRLRKNGANGNLNVSIPGSSTATVEDTTNFDTVTAGDLINYSVTTGTGTGTISPVLIQMDFEAQYGIVSLYCFVGNDGVSHSVAGTNYNNIHNAARESISDWASTDLVRKRAYVGAGATFSDLRVSVITNTSNAASVFTLVKNGSATSMSVTVPAGTTGDFTDYTNDVTVSPGDHLIWELNTTGRTTGGIAIGHIELHATATGNDWDLFSFNKDITSSRPDANVANYWAPGAWHNPDPTEAYRSIKMYTDTAAVGLQGISSSAFFATIAVRVNGVDSALAITLAADTNLYTDTDLIPFSAGDILSVGGVAPSTTTDGLALLTLTMGPAAIDIVATGDIGTVNFTSPEGSVTAGGSASGNIGTVTLATPTASAATGASASGDIGTITFNPPEGNISFGVDASGDIGTIHLLPMTSIITQMTMFGLEVLTLPVIPDPSLTQFGLGVLANQPASLRSTQMGLLVLARGGETPVPPDPLSLRDMGRRPPLRQRLVNMYSEPTPQGPAASARFGRPGLYEVAVRGGGPVHATFKWQEYRMTVSGNTVWRDGVNIHVFSQNLPVRYAVSEEECVIVHGGRPYYVTPTKLEQIVDPDLPEIRDVEYLSGRFVYAADDNSGQFFWSDLNDARSIDGLAFASAEGHPDPIKGLHRLGDRIAIYGTNTVEWWYTSADPEAPFQRSPGQRYDKGIISIRTSRLLDNSLFFVGSDLMVYRTGASPVRVSNYDIDDKLRRVPKEDWDDITAFDVTFGGHAFYVVFIPGFGSHAFDVSQQTWAEWRSWRKDRFRVCSADEGFLGDYYSGKIMGFDGQTYTDLGEPLERICSSFAPVKSGVVRNFNLALLCTRGVGKAAGYGSDPVVEMRFSDGEGANFSRWLEARLGAEGDVSKNALAFWSSLGSMQAPGRLFEFRCTDPVAFIPYQLNINEHRT